MGQGVRPVPALALPRPKLFERLDATRGFPGTWVHGPAGAGKTTLVATWLGARRARGPWLTLDAADAEPATFFDELATAVEAQAPGTPRLPRCEPGTEPGAFSRHLFSRLAAALPRAVVVLDDCGEVPDEAPLFSALAAGLAAPGRGARLVLLSRRGPPPALGPLVGRGRLAVVGPQELLLGPAEVAGMAALHGVTEAGAVEALVASAEGWAAGVVLQLEAARHWRSAGSPLSATPAAFEYLASEVLERMDADTRRVLLETSVLPWVDAAEAEGALGVAGTGEALEALARRGAFTTALEGQRRRYRLHPLLHALLRARAARALPPERLQALRLAGAAALERLGEPVEAMALLAAAGARPALEALLLRCGPGLLGAGRTEALRRWSGALSPDQVAASPGLRLLRGLCAFGPDATGAQADLEAAVDGFEATGVAEGAYQAWAAWTDAVLYAAVPEALDRCLDRLEALQRRFPLPGEPELSARVAGSALHAYGFRRPRGPAILDSLLRSQALDATTPRTRLLTTAALGDYLLNRSGPVSVARAALEDAAAVAGQADPTAVVVLRSVQALCDYFAGEGGRAAARVREALAFSAATGARMWDGLLCAELAWASTQAGALDTAEAALAQGARLDDGSRPMLGGWLHLARCHLAGARGERAPAAAEAALARRCFERAGCDIMATAALANQAVAARLEPAAAGVPTLEDALAATREVCTRIGEQFALMGLAARELETAGPRLQARLEAAFGLAAETGYRIAPALAPAEQAAVCAAALERGVAVETVRDWVRLNHLTAPPGLAPGVAWPRELELRLLGEPEVTLRGRALGPEVVGGRGLALLAALALRGEGPAPAGELAEALWPQAEGDAARHALQTAVYRLRRVLGVKDLLQLRGGTLRLAPGRVEVDLWELERRLTALERGGPPAEAGARRAAAEALERLDRGPLLPGLDLPEVVERRRHLERRVARALELLR